MKDSRPRLPERIDCRPYFRWPSVVALAARGLATYEYRFSYVATSMRDQWQSGAPHATEIPYVFDTVAVKYDRLSSTDAAVARAANPYWVNFAKTGDPNGPGLPIWPKYKAETDMILDFAADGQPRSGADPWRVRLDLTRAIADKAH